MSAPDALNVWHEQRLFGELWRYTTGTLGFRYDPEWMADNGFAVPHSKTKDQPGLRAPREKRPKSELRLT